MGAFWGVSFGIGDSDLVGDLEWLFLLLFILRNLSVNRVELRGGGTRPHKVVSVVPHPKSMDLTSEVPINIL